MYPNVFSLIDIRLKRNIHDCYCSHARTHKLGEQRNFIVLLSTSDILKLLHVEHLLYNCVCPDSNFELELL